MTGRRATLPYTPFPRQGVFHASPAGEVLFGGAAGPGKSLALLWEMFHQAVEVPGNTLIVFRRTYPQLHESMIQRSLETFPRSACEYNAQRHEWAFRNGSRFLFGHCQHEDSIYGYQGAQFGGIGVDEITEWTEAMYRFALRLLRTTNPRVWPRMRSTSNPIGIGFDWVKARWVQPVLDGRVDADEVWRPAPTDDDMEPMTRAYIPARHVDNPALLTADPGYLGRLRQLSRRERVALLEGRWDLPAFEGQLFGPEIILAAQAGAIGFQPARWRCPICGLDYTAVTGAAQCPGCTRPLLARRYLSAWDLARKVNWVVGITADITELPAQIVAFDRFKKVPWPEVARRIEARHAAYPGSTVIDSTGVGDPVLQFLKVPVEGMLFSPKSKTEMVQALILALEREELKGPATGQGIEALWRELSIYQWEDKDLTQDCVMAAAMLARAIQTIGPPGASAQVPPQPDTYHTQRPSVFGGHRGGGASVWRR